MFGAEQSTERLHTATDDGAGAYDRGISEKKRKIKPLCELIMLPANLSLMRISNS